jgi:hypothetical protein
MLQIICKRLALGCGKDLLRKQSIYASKIGKQCQKCLACVTTANECIRDHVHDVTQRLCLIVSVRTMVVVHQLLRRIHHSGLLAALHLHVRTNLYMIFTRYFKAAGEIATERLRFHNFEGAKHTAATSTALLPEHPNPQALAPHTQSDASNRLIRSKSLETMFCG